MEPFVSEIENAISTVQSIIAGVCVVAGVIQAFFGFKIFKFTLRVGAFFAGFFVGSLLGLWLTVSMDSASSAIPIIVLLGIAAGTVCAIFIYKVYQIAIFLGVAVPIALAAFVGSFMYGEYTSLQYSLNAISKTAYQSSENTAGTIIIIGLILAVAAGFFAIFHTKIAIIISSVLSGAGLVSGNIGTVLENDGKGLVIMSALLVAIIGFIYQWKSNRGKGLNLGKQLQGKADDADASKKFVWTDANKTLSIIISISIILIIMLSNHIGLSSEIGENWSKHYLGMALLGISFYTLMAVLAYLIKFKDKNHKLYRFFVVMRYNKTDC